MNATLFQFVHSAAHVSPLIDAAIVFSADYLAFIFFFALVAYEGWQWMKGRRERARTLIRAMGIAGSAWLVAAVLKELILSPRPFLVIDGIEPLIRHGGYDSFPSGHVTFFFALGAALFFSTQRPFSSSTSGVSPSSAVVFAKTTAESSSTPDVFPKNGRFIRFLGFLFMAAAILMGIARVAAGIHWPVDIVGAVLLGISVVIGLRACYYWGSRRWALDEDW